MREPEPESSSVQTGGVMEARLGLLTISSKVRTAGRGIYSSQKPGIQ